jgi:hypothetical protein
MWKVILVDSVLNDDNIRNQDIENDDSNTDPQIVWLWMDPLRIWKHRTTHQNLSSYYGHFFRPSASPKPTDEDLIDELCLYINMVDIPSLE